MVSNSTSRTLAWIVWIIASMFYAYQYILRVMPSIILSDIMQQFDISVATFGQFSGVYYIGYSLMHLPIGIMLDRYGPRKVMTICILLTVIGLTPLIFAKHWIYPILGRFLIGLGSSAAILGVFKIIRMTFDQKSFPRMLSVSVTIGLIGAIYGGGPLSYMRSLLGYQAILQIFAVVGLFLAGFTYWIIPESQNSSTKTVRSDLKEVLTNSKVIWSCIFAGLMVGPLEGFADAWGTLFFKQVYGFEATAAASIASFIFVGMCFGAPVLSLLADKIGCYLVTIITAGIIMAVSFICLLIWQLPSEVLTFNVLVVGVCCAYQILAIYKISTFAKEHVVGLTTAIANMIIMIFGYLFHSTIGGVVNIMGGPTSSHALVCGTVIVPITLIIGTGGFVILLIQEKQKKEITI